MLYQVSREYPQALGLLSSTRPAVEPMQRRWRLSWRPLIHTAERLLRTIGRIGKQAIPADDCAWQASPRVATSNMQTDIMRIEARRRI
jgi:hypothetical protein